MMKNPIMKMLALGLLLISAGCGKNNSNESSKVQSTETQKEKEYWCEIYANPVNVVSLSGAYYRGEVADPSIVKGDDGYFYMVGSNQVFLRSEDACNWEVVSEKIINLPSWGRQYNSGSYGVWAPDLIKIGDQWIYYYSLSGWGNPIGIGYATADDIAGPYTDQGKLFTCEEIGIQNAIDPQPIIDEDGTVYLALGSFQGVYLVELTEDGTECYGGIEYQNEEKILIAGRAGEFDYSTYEGSYIVKRGDYYYFFGSVGTCCVSKESTYKVHVGRSDNIAGPYRDKNKYSLTMAGSGKTYGELVVWAGRSETERDVIAPGHNSVLIDDAGDYWMYYHAYSSEDNYYTRHLFMDKIQWDEDGFPYIETKKPSFQEVLDGPRFIIEG